MKNPRRATKAAIKRTDNLGFALGSLLAIVGSGGHPAIAREVERRFHNEELLKARLIREHKRFRIRWADLLTALGASALFVAFIVYIFWTVTP